MSLIDLSRRPSFLASPSTVSGATSNEAVRRKSAPAGSLSNVLSVARRAPSTKREAPLFYITLNIEGAEEDQDGVKDEGE